MRTFGLEHLKVYALVLIDFDFVDDANSVVVVAVFNDAGACNDKAMVRTDP